MSRALDAAAERERRFVAYVSTEFSAELALAARDSGRRHGFRAAVGYVVEHAETDDRPALARGLYRTFLSADETYLELRDQARAAIDALRARLDRHAERQARDPKNYGFVGDLESLLERLGDALPWAEEN